MRARTRSPSVLAALALISSIALSYAQGAPTTPAPAGSGPMPALMIAEASLATHTVYRPAQIEAAPARSLPIIAWANGGCRNAGNGFRRFLADIASYGYLVIAIGPIVADLEESPRQPEAAASAAAPPPVRQLQGEPQTRSAQLIEAIDWAIAENRRAGSVYFGRIDERRIAVMGQSCGGLQALEASADPRVTTSMIWNSGLFPSPTNIGGGKAMSKEDLSRLHAPLAYITGDPQDIAFSNAEDDFARINHVPVLRAWLRGAPHGGTYREPNGGEFSSLALAWLNWRLKGDRRAAGMFEGEMCGLCVNPRWVVARKKID